MKAGDFSTLAKSYNNRAGYHKPLLSSICGLILQDQTHQYKLKVADVGAGTGKLTKILCELNANVIAVEPNDAMREEGKAYTAMHDVSWLQGSGESTSLASSSLDWLLMASSFHWTDPLKSLPEFSRVLKPRGYITLLWNPRDLEICPLQMEIEALIREKVPNLSRRSSGASPYTQNIEETITNSGLFSDVIFMEAKHNLEMSPERYMGVWKSVNDIPSQTSKEIWLSILDEIAKKISHLDKVTVPYKTRAWTARAIA